MFFGCCFFFPLLKFAFFLNIHLIQRFPWGRSGNRGMEMHGHDHVPALVGSRVHPYAGPHQLPSPTPAAWIPLVVLAVTLGQHFAHVCSSNSGDFPCAVIQPPTPPSGKSAYKGLMGNRSRWGRVSGTFEEQVPGDGKPLFWKCHHL